MLELFVALLIGAIIFCLAWWLISIIPFPPNTPAANFRWILYALLILIAIVWLLGLLPGGVHFPK